MGVSIAWLAVRSTPRDDLHAALRLRPTGELQEYPESPIVGLQLSTGWYVVYFNRVNRGVDDALLQELSRRAECVSCFVEEHSMFSSANRWKDGGRSWTVEHNSERGLKHLDLNGEIPLQLPEIRDRLLAKLAKAGKKPDCDYLFDAPIELAGAVTGFRFRHDYAPEDAGDGPFEVLETAFKSG